METERLDAAVAREFNLSRQHAREIIESGGVLVDGRAAAKHGARIKPGSAVSIIFGWRKYVSRGGVKLEAALNGFGIDVSGADCLDVGASTGGFTDCLLSRGASRVTALDVGHGQLHERLRGDGRVVSIEGVNFKHITPAHFSAPFDFICCDVSFISAVPFLPVASAILKGGGEAVILIKPQFEAGRGGARKGVVKDEAVRERAADGVRLAAQSAGFEVRGLTLSPVTGKDGNAEYLIYIYKPVCHVAQS
jgi:23S rRNA (cytidine1920-2'-O)/16S rRNA (cytidine1409-2'-O)-methyltransferase